MTASRSASFVFALALAAASLPAWAAAPAKPASKPREPLATVNGKEIPQADYDRAIKMFTQQAQHSGQQQPDPTALRTKVMQQLIHRELLYQTSLKYPVKDLNRKVDAEFAKVQGQFPNVEAFRAALKSDSMTEADLKGLMRKQLSIANYVQTQIAPKTKVTPADVEKFYKDNPSKFQAPEQVRASHILIPFPKNATPDQKKQALAKAQELRKRAAKGEDFAKLARENSQDPGSAAKGGDLGFFTRERMVEPFAKAAFALKPGQVSEVVESPFGYHVIKLAERKPAGKQSFADVKSQLTDYLKAAALDQAVQKKVVELEKTAKITIQLPAK